MQTMKKYVHRVMLVLIRMDLWKLYVKIVLVARTSSSQVPPSAYHAFLELSTIYSEKALAIRAHLDFLPMRRSSSNATHVSWACMRHNKVRRSVSCVFQVSTVTLSAQSTVRHVLLTRSPLKWVLRFAIHRRRIKSSAPVDPPSSLLPKDGT